MKKFWLIVLALVMVLPLAACKEDPSPDNSTGPAVTEPDTNTEQEPAGDQDQSDPAVGNEAAVDRAVVKILTGITVTEADGSTSGEYCWSLYESRLLASLSITEEEPAREVAFAYQESEKTVAATGLDADVSITFRWDDSGRIVSILENSGSGTYGITYSYDQEGRCVGKAVTRDDQPGSTTEYTFDAAGNLLTECVTLPDGSISRKTTFTYNENGDLVEEINDRMDGDPSVWKYSYTYGENGLPMTRITLDDEGNETFRREYTYDSEGRILTETASSSSGRSSRSEYAYDEDGNLIQEKVYSSNGELDETIDYTFEEAYMSDAEYELYHMLTAYSENWY